MSCTIVRIDRDLRLQDNPALYEASRRGAVVAVFIMDESEFGQWTPGGASKWWLHYALESFARDLERHGGKLILRSGEAGDQLLQLLKETGADAVYWNRPVEEPRRSTYTRIRTRLEAAGARVAEFNGSLLFSPKNVLTQSGNPYTVFTAFWKCCQSQPEPDEPLPAPVRLAGISDTVKSLALDQLRLLPNIDWAQGLRKNWQVSEAAAQKMLSDFLSDTIFDYDDARDLPGTAGTSKFSPYLHFGQVSVRQIWHELKAVRARTADERESLKRFATELGWRDFAHYLLYHFPQTTDEPLRSEFSRLATARNDDLLHAWERGRTGYPIVDAGMRQLWITGWMHNRVRMIVASFLVKHLLIPWQDGARWFWDTLVDADLANNTLGWQWSAGCGADAAPFFRIFNPILQGEKFDPDGTYVKTWLPELAGLDKKYIHSPWTAPPLELQRAAVRLGENYPRPIIDHQFGRERALQAFKDLRSERVVATARKR